MTTLLVREEPPTSGKPPRVRYRKQNVGAEETYCLPLITQGLYEKHEMIIAITYGLCIGVGMKSMPRRASNICTGAKRKLPTLGQNEGFKTVNDSKVGCQAVLG